MEEVIVTRPYGAGNAVQAIPALEMLKQAGIKFKVWVEHPQVLALYEGMFDTIGRVKGDSDFSCRTWISLYPWDRAMIPSHYGRKIGYHTQDRIKAVNGVEIWSVNEARFNAETVASYLGQPVPEALSCRIRDLGGLVPSGKRIGLHPGCQRGVWTVKRWPEEKWHALAALLVKRNLRVRVFGTTADEGGALNGMHAEFGDSMEWCVDKPPKESARSAGECTVFVSNDSGMSHLAVAGGCRKVIVLYGPTRPEKSVHDSMITIRSVRSCPYMPCYSWRFDRKCDDNRCMKDIGVMRVLKEALK